jgi:hypothetical protein
LSLHEPPDWPVDTDMRGDRVPAAVSMPPKRHRFAAAITPLPGVLLTAAAVREMPQFQHVLPGTRTARAAFPGDQGTNEFEGGSNA